MYNKYLRRAGVIAGVPYTIKRPVYTDNTGTETVIATNMFYRSSPKGKPWAEPEIGGVSFYSILGNKYIVNMGDVIIPNDPNEVTITISQNFPLKTILGFRTELTGSIETTGDGNGDIIYQNVRFALIGDTNLSQAINDALSSPENRTTKVVMYKRLNIPKNAWLVQNNDETGNAIRWQIRSYATQHNMLILTLAEEPL